MNKIISFLKKNYILYFSLLLIFGISFYLVSNSIWAADDYAFYNNVWSEANKFSFSTLFSKTNWFYLNWTGRYISTLINYFLIYFDKSLYNLLNALSNVYFIFIVCKLIDNKHNYLYVVTYMLMWLLIPAYGQVMLWQIGSVIYLWMANLGLTVLYFFNKNNVNFDGWKKYIIYILLFLFSIIAGNGFETNSIVLVTFMLISIFDDFFIKKEKIKYGKFIIFSGTFIGFLTNLLSPGNKVRLNSMGTGSNIFSRVYNGLNTWYFNGIIKTCFYVILPIIVILFMIYLIQYSNKKNYKLLNTLFIFAILFVVSLFGFTFIIFRFNYSDFIGFYYESVLKNNFIVVSIFFILLVWALLLFFNLDKIVIKERILCLKKNLYYFIAALVGVASYLVTPNAWCRSYMFMLILMVIAAVGLFLEIRVKKIVNYLILFLVTTVFAFSFYNAFIDINESNLWFKDVDNYIKEEINNGQKVIVVPAYLSSNSHNPASIEKWVIPAKIYDDSLATENGLHRDYEWINIEITNYYFEDKDAWNNGCRIYSVE